MRFFLSLDKIYHPHRRNPLSKLGKISFYSTKKRAKTSRIGRSIRSRIHRRNDGTTAGSWLVRRRSYKTCYIKIRTKERRKFTPKNYTTYYTYTIQSFTLKFFFFFFFKTSLREDRADRPTRNAIFFFFFLLFARAIRQSMAAFIPYVCPTTTRLNTFFLILLAPSARPAARGTSAIVAVAASRDCSTDEADRDPI